MNDIVKFEQRTEQYLVQYEKAVGALQAAKESLSLEGLTVVDITIEALRARGKIAQDERAKQAAHELEVEKYRTAAIIAQAIVDRDKPTIEVKRGRKHASVVTVKLSGHGVLMRAGWSQHQALTALRIGRATVPEIAAIKKTRRKLSINHPQIAALKGRVSNRLTRAKSETWSKFYDTGTLGGVRFGAVSVGTQRISAKQLAEEFEDKDEIILARRSVKQVRDWCDEFLKALPKS